jgi:hypothetical protein
MLRICTSSFLRVLRLDFFTHAPDSCRLLTIAVRAAELGKRIRSQHQDNQTVQVSRRHPGESEAMTCISLRCVPSLQGNTRNLRHSHPGTHLGQKLCIEPASCQPKHSYQNGFSRLTPSIQHLQHCSLPPSSRNQLFYFGKSFGNLAVLYKIC